MFGFLGNGFHVCEKDGSDISWYLGAPKEKVDTERVKKQMDGLKGIPYSEVKAPKRSA